MSAFSNWERYNVLEEHVIEDLQQDAELKAAGSLEVKEWAEDIAETADNLRDDKLPRVACDVSRLVREDSSTIAGNMIHVYAGVVEAIVARGDKANRLKAAKALAARIERRLMQAYQVSQAAAPHVSCKHLQNVEADIEGGAAATAIVTLSGTEIDEEPFSGQDRAVAAIGILIEIEFAIPED